MTFRITTSPDGTLAVVNLGPSDLPETDAAVHAVLSSAARKHNAEILAGRRPTTCFDFDRCDPVPPFSRPVPLRHRVAEYLAAVEGDLLRFGRLAWRIYRFLAAVVVTLIILRVFIVNFTLPTNATPDPGIGEPLFTPSIARGAASANEFQGSLRLFEPNGDRVGSSGQSVLFQPS